MVTHNMDQTEKAMRGGAHGEEEEIEFEVVGVVRKKYVEKASVLATTRDTVTQNIMDYVKEDGVTPLDRPPEAPCPLKILFVGVDNEKFALKLNKEYEEIERAKEKACTAAQLESSKPPSIELKQKFYSNWSDIVKEIRDFQPTILHVGCHAKEKGLELFQQMLEPNQMLEAIRVWNKYQCKQRSPRPIRVILLNACESEDHAHILSEGVDFAIGHRAPVYDDDAVKFSDIFYDFVFKGESLLDSFKLAKSGGGYQRFRENDYDIFPDYSKGYRLYFSQQDPRHFFLVHSRHLSATASDNQLVSDAVSDQLPSEGVTGGSAAVLSSNNIYNTSFDVCINTHTHTHILYMKYCGQVLL
jgi:hypothetical protein